MNNLFLKRGLMSVPSPSLQTPLVEASESSLLLFSPTVVNLGEEAACGPGLDKEDDKVRLAEGVRLT